RTEDELRRDQILRRDLLSILQRLLHSRAHLAEPRDVMLGVFLRLHWMIDRQQTRQVDIDSSELLKGEFVIEIGLALYDTVELPFHQLGRLPLNRSHLRAIKLAQIGESTLRQFRASLLIRGSRGGDLLLELLLLSAREVARGSRGIGVPAHPFVGEGLKKLVD